MGCPVTWRHAWWWVSGHPMHGRHMSNSTWLHKGTKALHPTGRVVRWHHLPRLARAGIRTGGSIAALVTCWGLLFAPGVTEAAWATALAAAGAWGVWRGYLRLRRFTHHRSWVHPLHVSLGPAIGIPAESNPGDWLTIPRGYQQLPGAQITVQLPEAFIDSRDARQLVESAVTGKLALEDPAINWQMAGRTPRVVFDVESPPPDKVTLADIRDAMERAKPTAPVLGIGRAGKIRSVDLENDSPHVMFSMGSGAGKSVATRLLAAQILHNGGIVLVLDIKRLSHAWARGLPNVRYCRSDEEIHNGLLWAEEELNKRNQLADEGADIDGNTDGVDIGPRLLVLAEEMNATAARLRSYWNRTKDKGDPPQSPAIEALASILFMGRQVNANLAAVAQMFSARICGPEGRENMGSRILGRYSMNNWRMLVPEIWPMPRSSRKPGRVQVCSGGFAHETQVAYLTPAETREWALSGTVTPFPVPGEVIDRRQQVVVAAEAIGLREATDRGIFGATNWEAVRKAFQRDPERPEPVKVGPGGERLYDPADLRVWAGNRPRAKVDA